MGERAVNRDGVTHKAVARYQGLLVDAFVAMLPEAETTAVVVEFGTLPRPRMQRASMAARWLWEHQDADGALRAMLMRDIRGRSTPARRTGAPGSGAIARDLRPRLGGTWARLAPTR